MVQSALVSTSVSHVDGSHPSTIFTISFIVGRCLSTSQQRFISSHGSTLNRLISTYLAACPVAASVEVH